MSEKLSARLDMQWRVIDGRPDSDGFTFVLPEQIDELRALESFLAQAQADVEALRNKYSEILYGVATKHPGESRHETALRYILERENRSSGPTSAALPEHLRGASR